MYQGRVAWRQIKDRSTREERIHRALGTLNNRSSITLFAVIADRGAVSDGDPMSFAFEQLCNRFNLFLSRNNKNRGDNQRGLIVMDETRHRKPLQELARTFRVNGGRWGHFTNLAEVPFFVDSMASRMVQLADLVAWATYRRYQFADGRFFEPLLPLFDANAGVIHGLYHHRKPTDLCYCPACMSRSLRDG